MIFYLITMQGMIFTYLVGIETVLLTHFETEMFIIHGLDLTIRRVTISFTLLVPGAALSVRRKDRRPATHFGRNRPNSICHLDFSHGFQVGQ